MSLPYFTLLSQCNGELMRVTDTYSPQEGHFVLYQDTLDKGLYLICKVGAKNNVEVQDSFYSVAERQRIPEGILADYFDPVMTGSFSLGRGKLRLMATACDRSFEDNTEDIDGLIDDLIRESGHKHLELEEVVY